MKYFNHKLIDDKGTDKKTQCNTINDDLIRQLGRLWRCKFEEYSSSKINLSNSKIQRPRFRQSGSKIEKFRYNLVEGDDRNYLYSNNEQRMNYALRK